MGDALKNFFVRIGFNVEQLQVRIKIVEERKSTFKRVVFVQRIVESNVDRHRQAVLCRGVVGRRGHGGDAVLGNFTTVDEIAVGGGQAQAGLIEQIVLQGHSKVLVQSRFDGRARSVPGFVDEIVDLEGFGPGRNTCPGEGVDATALPTKQHKA